MTAIVERAELDGYSGPGIVVRDHFRLRPGQPGRAAAGFGPVVVLAETTIAPGAGFPMHAHAGSRVAGGGETLGDGSLSR